MVGWVRRKSCFRAGSCGNGVDGSGSGDNVVVVVVCFCRHGKKWLIGRINAFAPEGQTPVCEGAVVGIDLCVFY